MPRELLFVTGKPAAKLDQEVLDQMRAKAYKQRLEEAYHRTDGRCCKCGVHISTEFGEPLGRYFVMDTQGRFYCMHCDKHFGEGDERIYVPEEDM